MTLAPPPFPLPPITYPLRIGTVGICLALGYSISIHCETQHCHHSGTIDLLRLARRLGMDHSSMAPALQAHFFCPKCRAAGRPDKALSFKLSPPTHPMSRIPEDHPSQRPA